MAKHRFDWSEESVAVLNEEALKWLNSVDWNGINGNRDQMLLQFLQAKSRTSSLN